LQTVSLGKHNPRLTAIRKAIQHGTLTADGLLPLEGPKLLDEAIRSSLGIDAVLVRRGSSSVASAVYERRSVPAPSTYELDPEVFKSIQSTETSQGVMALVRVPAFSMEDLLKAPRPRIIVLARLQDPGNVGTILRIAESFYATGCIALTGTVSVYNPKTLRASAGSVLRLPHVWNTEFDAVRRLLKEASISLIGTSPAAENSIATWNWKEPVALIIGNEGGGLSEQELRGCDAVLSIPHNPAVESLNSAIATAVILYEATRHERITV